MTSIVVVKKNNIVTIAADTLTKWGSGKETAEHIINSSKILNLKGNYVGVTGNATFKLVLNDYFSSRENINLSSVSEIFSTWNKLHGVLKSNYYLLPEEDKDDSIESSRMDVLIANIHGIFGVSGHRTVQEFSKYYAYGSGSDYALGALWSLYESSLESPELARKAIEAAAEFDDGTGLPIDVFTINLAQ